MPNAATRSERPHDAGASTVVTRRALLAGGAALPVVAALAACTGDPEPVPPDPDRQQLEAAREVELTLLTVLRGAETAPVAVVAAVEQHLVVLDEALGEPSASTSPSASASESSSASPTEALAAADRATDAHTRALRTATARVSPLLASIAASDAAIASTLRPGTS